MGTAARAEELALHLRTRRAAIEARRQSDQARLVGGLRAIARALLPDAEEDRVRSVSQMLGDDHLCEVLDDLERTAEAERTRLRAVAVHEHLREPTRRVQALERRHADAIARAERFRAELERLDIDAFRWLKARHRRRATKLTQSEKMWRAVTLARLREQRAEAALRESLGHEGFDSAAAAYERAEKGLRRAEVEAEHVAHTRAFIRDLQEEHADLQERVADEASRRLRALRSALEARLVVADLPPVVSRAPSELRPALSESHAVEVRLRGWEDLESALDAAVVETETIARSAWTTEDPAALDARLDAQARLPDAIDRVVDILAAFHDFDIWHEALEAGRSPACWAVLAGAENQCLSPELLGQLIPRLVHRPVCGGVVVPTA